MKNQQELIDEYLYYCLKQRKLDEKTVRAYRIDLRQFSEFCVQKKLVTEKAIIRQYILHLHESYKQKTVKRKVASIKAFYSYLEDEEIIDDSPLRKIRTEFREEKILPRSIPYSILQSLLSSMYSKKSIESTISEKKLLNRDIAVVETLFSTGIRISELCNLMQKNIDIEQGIFCIKGKGGKERYLQIGTGEVLAQLKEYKRHWEKELNLSEFFFLNRYGERYSEQSARRMIQRYTQEANSVIQVILVLLCKTVLFVIVLILDYFWKREKELDVKKSEWILMISFPMMTVVIMLVMLLSFQQKNNSFGYLTVSFGMVSINLVMFVLLKYISAREKQYNQMKILQERNKEKMQAYYEFSEDYAQKKRMVHDYNNQIHCIQGLLRQNKYREAEEYADKLTEILIDGREVIDVNNTVLNVVLNQKYRLAKSKDIALYFQVNDLSGLWMKEQDVVILLSNLLDNAIEACEKLDCNKVIRLKLVKEKQQMVLSVQNPVAVPVEIKNNDIQTGKGDKKNHGIGLKNIQMVLDKYGGIGRIRCDKGWFYYTAVIPQTEEI